MKLRVIAPLVVALALAASTASAQSIGVYFDPNAASCSGTVLANTPTTWYILALLGGPVAGGISGAEFREDGTPAGWFMTPNPNPASNLALGNPNTGGCNIAFAGCQPGTGGVVLLYTVSGFATSPVVNNTLSINRHTSPSNPLFICPLVTLCDGPVFTKVCVRAGEGFINRSGNPCTVAVEQKSWSNVKALYSN